MKHEERLAGIVQLDTLFEPHRYGLGPVAYLQGEILLWNDTVFVSRVENGSNAVRIAPTVEAPFLVYASVPTWSTPQPIADTLISLPQLQAIVEQQAVAAGKSLNKPFPFVLQGTARRIVYHVMNRPVGEAAHNPAMHQQAKQFFTLKNEVVQLLGFYSRHHQGVFTHRDSYVHVHVINQGRTKMGHLDELTILPADASLILPIDYP